MCVYVLVAQSCLILCDPMDSSPLGSSVHGILQARILEWVFPSLGDLPGPGIKLRSPALQADSLPAEPSRKPNKYHRKILKPLSLPLSHGDVPSVSIRVTMLKPKYLKRLNSNKNGKSRQVVKAPGSRVQCWTKACRDHLSYFYRKSSWPLPGCDVELILQEFQLFR